jgi:ABC-type phosphate/phosphonate transport system substrate-binding protein
MGRLSGHKKTRVVNVVRLAAAMYAAQAFAKEAQARLEYLGIGIVPETLGQNLRAATESLESRLKEMREGEVGGCGN